MRNFFPFASEILSFPSFSGFEEIEELFHNENKHFSRDSKLGVEEHLKKRPRTHQFVSQSFTTIHNGVTKKHHQESYKDSNGVHKEFTKKAVNDKIFTEYKNGEEVQKEFTNVSSQDEFETAWKTSANATQAIKDASETSRLETLTAQLEEAKQEKKYKECITLKAAILDEKRKLEMQAKSDQQREENLQKRNQIKELQAKLQKAEASEDFEQCLVFHDKITKLERELSHTRV